MDSRTAWKPVPGVTTAIADSAGLYRDVFIREIHRRKGVAHVCELADIDNKKVFTEVSLDILKSPLVPDINTRFLFMEDLVGLTLRNIIKALFIFGEGGIGKTFTVQQLLDERELIDGEDYVIIKGHSSPRATFNLLNEYRDRLVIFDDCDSVLTNATTENVIKAVLDAWSKKREVTWLTTGSGSGLRKFEFTGTVIFISNKSKDKIDGAVLSRCVSIDMEMTTEEKILRLSNMLTKIKSPLKMHEREKVFDIIKEYRYNVKELNIRTLLKAMDIYKESTSLELVKYQILQ